MMECMAGVQDQIMDTDKMTEKEKAKKAQEDRERAECLAWVQEVRPAMNSTDDEKILEQIPDGVEDAIMKTLEAHRMREEKKERVSVFWNKVMWVIRGMKMSTFDVVPGGMLTSEATVQKVRILGAVKLWNDVKPYVMSLEEIPEEAMEAFLKNMAKLELWVRLQNHLNFNDIAGIQRYPQDKLDWKKIMGATEEQLKEGARLIQEMKDQDALCAIDNPRLVEDLYALQDLWRQWNNLGWNLRKTAMREEEEKHEERRKEFAQTPWVQQVKEAVKFICDQWRISPAHSIWGVLQARFEEARDPKKPKWKACLKKREFFMMCQGSLPLPPWCPSMGINEDEGLGEPPSDDPGGDLKIWSDDCGYHDMGIKGRLYVSHPVPDDCSEKVWKELGVLCVNFTFFRSGGYNLKIEASRGWETSLGEASYKESPVNMDYYAYAAARSSKSGVDRKQKEENIKRKLVELADSGVDLDTISNERVLLDNPDYQTEHAWYGGTFKREAKARIAKRNKMDED